MSRIDHFIIVKIYFTSEVLSTGSLLPMIVTAIAPTALPMNPTISIGVPIETSGVVIERNASPAPMLSITFPEKAGI